MNIAARLAAWWAVWKWIVVLALLCATLAALNVWQAYLALTRPIRAENAALTRALDQINGIAERRDRDDKTLLASLEAIAARGQQVRVVYKQAAAAAPLPEQCAPGAARMDAVNRALSGAQPESSP